MISNIDKVYTVGKYNLSRVSGSLHQICFFIEIRANDPSTFVRNKMYHLEEGVEMIRLASNLIVKIDWTPPF